VWLSLNQVAHPFQRDRSVISVGEGAQDNVIAPRQASAKRII